MKSDVSRIIAWHPVLTDHQAFTYEELSRQSGLPVVVKVARLQDETRTAQGWPDTRVTGVERQLIQKRSFLRDGLRYLLDNRDQIHFFGSAFEDPRILLLLWFATRLRLECYIISEPYSSIPFSYFGKTIAWQERLKTLLRPWLYRAYIIALRSGLKGIFTISRLAALQFSLAGMSTNRLFPFGYFVPLELSPKQYNFATDIPDRPLRIAFVGSLIDIKGLPTLIDATRLAIARGANLHLDIYGPGDPSSFDIDGVHISFAGCIPFGYTQQQLLGYDLLVLPSHYDGWGVVVNEAIYAGVPILCSDNVGARVLVETFGVGRVFPRGDELVLANQFIELAAQPDQLKRMKSACEVAAKAIQPSRAATYMLEVLLAKPAERSAIPSPWYLTN